MTPLIILVYISSYSYIIKMKKLEREYLERVRQRDVIEKKEHQQVVEDFQKYNREIRELKAKNSEMRDFFLIIFGGQGSEMK